jgi:hypothetical protein
MARESQFEDPRQAAGVSSLALIGNASAHKVGAKSYGLSRGIFDKETKRKPLAFAADAAPMAIRGRFGTRSRGRIVGGVAAMALNIASVCAFCGPEQTDPPACEWHVHRPVLGRPVRKNQRKSSGRRCLCSRAPTAEVLVAQPRTSRQIASRVFSAASSLPASSACTDAGN